MKEDSAQSKWSGSNHELVHIGLARLPCETQKKRVTARSYLNCVFELIFRSRNSQKCTLITPQDCPAVSDCVFHHRRRALCWRGPERPENQGYEASARQRTAASSCANADWRDVLAILMH